jgi:hypothetical protein
MSEYAIDQLLETIAHTDEIFSAFEFDDEDVHSMLEEMRDKFTRRKPLLD